MESQRKYFNGMVSSDWSECLSPNGPFDPIGYNYPDLENDLHEIFNNYTGNRISLSEAIIRIKNLIPNGLSLRQMDEYLENCFQIYTGVYDFINWLSENKILFMINSTGSQGYFQRAIAKGTIPVIPFISANPFIFYDSQSIASKFPCEVLEIEHKARCTEMVAIENHISYEKIIIIGDSGGDGPHFKWGASNGASLVGSMTKFSLSKYCEVNSIKINKHIGPLYKQGDKRDQESEYKANFTDLKEFVSFKLGI